MIELDITNKTYFTYRKDNWKTSWFILGTVFSLFSLYTLIVVIFDYDHGIHGAIPNTNFTSPLYGPKIFDIPFYAFLTLWAPFGFRGTCYYMRKVYYRTLFQSPPACAVQGLSFRKGKYTGESRSLFWLNNFHRYFLYAAILLAFFHWYEALSLFFYEGRFYFGFGVVLALLDATMLTFYVVSCHAFRHLLGGSVNRQGSMMNKVWAKISKLNKYHPTWFWLSITSIFIYDLYIRVVSWGLIPDLGVLF